MTFLRVVAVNFWKTQKQINGEILQYVDRMSLFLHFLVARALIDVIQLMLVVTAGSKHVDIFHIFPLTGKW